MGGCVGWYVGWWAGGSILGVGMVLRPLMVLHRAAVPGFVRGACSSDV